VCEIPQDGTNAPKHVVVKVHTLKCVCNLGNKLVLQMKIHYVTYFTVSVDKSSFLMMTTNRVETYQELLVFLSDRHAHTNTVHWMVLLYFSFGVSIYSSYISSQSERCFKIQIRRAPVC
jgi:hypothetical protein